MRKGFTLIELLVVIAIIAILAAILFPVFARAREKARQASCLSNVKEVMLAILMYADDYDETLCPAAYWSGMYWYVAIDPYLGTTKILRCPSGDRDMTRGPGRNTDYGWNYQEFGLFNDSRPGWVTKLAELNSPSETILICDSTGNSSTYLIYRFWGKELHNGGANFGLCDGHAKWFNPQQVVRQSGWWREDHP